MQFADDHKSALDGGSASGYVIFQPKDIIGKE
jgi:hypothetical protein